MLMWVYGDAQRTGDVQDLATHIVQTLDDASALSNGIARHEAIARAFVDAAELIQGLIDRTFHERGFDAASPEQTILTQLLFAFAGVVERSWQSGFTEQVVPETLVDDLKGVARDYQGAITTRSAEGYSIYALYPETYLEAAQASGLGSNTIVIGIRSIGLSLSCLVAAALKAPAPISLRPTGDPFARRIEADPQLLDTVLARGDGPIAIVDEGPGLSGSSFFAVADWLERGGVARDRIHFFPSHAGVPGGQAPADHRQRWEVAPRHVRPFDTTFLQNNRLQGWIGTLLGPLERPLQDLSWGNWKRAEDASSPVDARLERRKFLADTANGSFLVKFAGLGSEGQRKFEVAKVLYRGGFAAEPVALLHGMIVEHWVGGEPLTADHDRARLLQTLGSYLAVRATLPAHNEGASLALLADVAAFNAGQAFGGEAEALVRKATGSAAALQHLVRPVDTDSRLHRWEWRVTPDQRLIKTDALDHSGAHDLVGCQDIAWDIAGAIVEHDLTQDETERLVSHVECGSGRAIERELMDLLLPCYLGFQTGLWSMALDAAADDHKPALRHLLERCKHQLMQL
ncbi:hypothetical protein JYU29_14380 [Tianweitania sp. BSSL-BM11]|uniref:Cell division protein FtsK n=1 Tax=Tianweitania aestuarii TaxID=2814886 RepID=A0ABS5S094_9HYPH|nr:hypothetical protein [Tianweitania aestuarii]MBS9721874.1 hypothetical protein [Tianweitania aestuarii]